MPLVVQLRRTRASVPVPPLTACCFFSESFQGGSLGWARKLGRASTSPGASARADSSLTWRPAWPSDACRRCAPPGQGARRQRPSCLHAWRGRGWLGRRKAQRRKVLAVDNRAGNKPELSQAPWGELGEAEPGPADAVTCLGTGLGVRKRCLRRQRETEPP